MCWKHSLNNLLDFYIEITLKKMMTRNLQNFKISTTSVPKLCEFEEDYCINNVIFKHFSVENLSAYTLKNNVPYLIFQRHIIKITYILSKTELLFRNSNVLWKCMK